MLLRLRDQARSTAPRSLVSTAWLCQMSRGRCRVRTLRRYATGSPAAAAASSQPASSQPATPKRSFRIRHKEPVLPPSPAAVRERTLMFTNVPGVLEKTAPTKSANPPPKQPASRAPKEPAAPELRNQQALHLRKVPVKRGMPSQNGARRLRCDSGDARDQMGQRPWSPGEEARKRPARSEGCPWSPGRARAEYSRKGFERERGARWPRADAVQKSSKHAAQEGASVSAGTAAADSREEKGSKASKATTARARPARKSLSSTGWQESQDAAATDTISTAKVRKVSSDRKNDTKIYVRRINPHYLRLEPIAAAMPPVPRLEYGLDRALFNPGVYVLQDPRSKVYNFDPYLATIMPVQQFDFNALKQYVTSSKDNTLTAMAASHGKKYCGSTSSMTALLAHFHFLLSPGARSTPSTRPGPSPRSRTTSPGST